MDIRNLEHRPEFDQEGRLNRKYKRLQKLIVELNKKDLKGQMVALSNSYVDQINRYEGGEEQLLIIVQNSYNRILSFAKEEFDIVYSGYYGGTWGLIGMSAFGFPLGLIGFLITANEVHVLLGMPLGCLLGYLIGHLKDTSAKRYNKQISMSV
ncbi:hypothetical protein OAA06_01715 [bacterium]|nr:hypothetical protein [bacterium]